MGYQAVNRCMDSRYYIGVHLKGTYIPDRLTYVMKKRLDLEILILSKRDYGIKFIKYNYNKRTWFNIYKNYVKLVRIGETMGVRNVDGIIRLFNTIPKYKNAIGECLKTKNRPKFYPNITSEVVPTDLIWLTQYRLCRNVSARMKALA